MERKSVVTCLKYSWSLCNQNVDAVDLDRLCPSGECHRLDEAEKKVAARLAGDGIARHVRDKSLVGREFQAADLA